MWNPSINKSKMLPPLEITRKRLPFSKYSFGHDLSPMIIRFLLFPSVSTKIKLVFILWVQVLGEGLKTFHVVALLLVREYSLVALLIGRHLII